MHAGFEGRELGHYRVTRLLGSGGMGEVYLARDLLLGRDVAIKVITAARGRADDSLTRRLLNEAKAVAALDHPNICPVHDAGTDPDGHPYMVMQYVPGETLSARLDRGPLPVREALTVAIKIADALAAAHARGIIHRDLKPQNVMMTPAGEPRLLDFGIAKALPAMAAEGETVTTLTGPYELIGTPSYVSPEQIRQQPIDGRSDLFSLGALLFESLTARCAFPGRNTAEILGEILQVHPPDPSTLRPELDERHDEVCRRLLAKDPADRFQSAEEVIGALRVLVPDTSRTSVSRSTRARWARSLPPPGWKRRTAIGAVVAGVVAVALLIGWPLLSRPPEVPPDAARHFERGTTALREGEFHTAAIALAEGIKRYPNDPLAYAHLAEARAELGDERGAQEALVQLSSLGGAALRGDARLRVDAVRSLVLGDVDRAVHAYRELTQRQPRDPSIWLDLGRAQEHAALLGDADTTYRRAVSIDQQYAAGYLRIGIVASEQGRKEDALAALDEAERLYRAVAHVEGEAEVCIRRGIAFNRAGEFAQARAALDRAVALAESVGSPFHLVRARIQLASVTASEGNYAQAEQIASTAVQSALDAGLDTVAAEGLIEVAGTLLTRKPAEAEALLRRSQAMAEKRGARRVSARAATQLASLQLGGSPAAALATLQPALDFFKDHHYRKYELLALSIAGRAHLRLDHLADARRLTSEALRGAEATGDRLQVADALVTTAGVAAATGALPEALEHRSKAEEIYRQQHDVRSLAFSLANRAELMILLGQAAAADAALKEMEAGIAANVGAFVERRRRVTYLRFLDAVLNHRGREAETLAAALEFDPKAADTTSGLGIQMLRYARAIQRQRPGIASRPDGAEPLSPSLQREYGYWDSAARLAAGEFGDLVTRAGDASSAAAALGNDELRWRTAAIGAAAARATRDAAAELRLRTAATESLERLRASWRGAAAAYERRPDLSELKRAAGIH